MPTFTSCIKSYDSSAFRVLRRLIICLCVSTFAGAQRQGQLPIEDQIEKLEKPFPGTPKQLQEILKANHEKNLKELEQMARLVEEVRTESQKNTQYVVSLQSLKNLEQIEKLSKAIRDRMKRY